MNRDLEQKTDRQDRPLTRSDVEQLLEQAGSSEQLVLHGRNLQNVDLSGVKLNGADLSGADLSGAMASNARFSKANLQKANLSGARLIGAFFEDADLRGTDLSKAILRVADFKGADLSGANLSEAYLSEAKLRGAIVIEANLQEANLSGADLSGANLRGADLMGANLGRITLGRNDFMSTSLWEADLSGARLINADLSGARLGRCNLSGADLSRANLRDADLSEVDLSNVSFKNVNLGQVVYAQLRDLLPEKYLAPHISEPNGFVELVPTFRLRLVEEPLTPSTLLSSLSAIADLATMCWLIANQRFADLIQYVQTHDARFVEESQLQFTRITYNSPFDASFKIDLSASNVAEGIVTALDGITQVKQKLRKAELENEARAQEIAEAKQKAEREEQSALVEMERQALAVERERLDLLEKQLDLQKKAIEYALEVAARTVAVLRPDVDDQIKAMLIQTLLPTLLQANNVKGLELVLLPGSKDETQQKEQPNDNA